MPKNRPSAQLHGDKFFSPFFSLSPVLFSSLLLFLLSCGYRWDYDYPMGHRPTIVVPFIPDDNEARLSTELIAKLENSGIVSVVPRNGDLRLEVKILGSREDQIGYRRDPQKIKNQIKKNLLASEGRRTVHFEVTVYRGNTKEIAQGPFLLSADADYDYIDGDSLQDLTFSSASGVIIPVLPFSLGQLEPIESAQEAALRSIYRKISQKIVDVISAEW